MKDDSKLADLLRLEWRDLLEQKHELERRMGAINLLLGGTADEAETALQAQDEADDAADRAASVAEPKKRRGRRSNAQIAADKAAEEAAKEPTAAASEETPAHAVITDEDEEAAQ